MSLKSKLSRLKSVPDDFLSKIPRAEAQLMDEIIAILARMDVNSRGEFVISSANLDFTAQIAELLKEALPQTEYLEAVADFARQFDEQAVINEDYFKKAFPEFKGSEIANQTVALAKRNTVTALLDTEYDTGVVQQVRDVIEASVVNGAGYKDTVTALREFIEGTPDVDGALTRYSRTWAHDAFAISDASYTSIVSEELDADWFFYSGDTIDTSRQFCIERHNEYFHWKEIESWFTGSPQPNKKWETEPWAGMIPGTDEATIYTYRGGFGCRHSILPVSLYAVPLTVVQRNIDSGNFSPTENQRARLGLPQQ